MVKKSHYTIYDKHYIAIDSIVFGFSDETLKLLLIKRKFDPCKDNWSLMGGFVGSNESLDEAAYRILEDLTGLRDLFLEQLYTSGDVERDFEDRVISVSYYALINIDNYNEKPGKKLEAEWFPVDSIPPLIFDHNKIVEKAMKRLQRKSIIEPIGFELLPEKFTLTQLQKLYEAIHMQRLDKRNFRKKILSMNVLTSLDEKDKVTSKRGAYLYKFDKDKYQYFISNGNSFGI